MGVRSIWLQRARSWQSTNGLRNALVAVHSRSSWSMIRWWLALNSYPQELSTGLVDNATHRPQSLTDCQDPSLYLKDNNLLNIKINKKIINIKIKNNKNLLAIPMSILILTISTTTEAKAAPRVSWHESTDCFLKVLFPPLAHALSRCVPTNTRQLHQRLRAAWGSWQGAKGGWGSGGAGDTLAAHTKK